tara:strand:+ start:15782 stop:15955 length:174 start_codon:yes stop_codon:yes gene_type:complete
MAQFGSASVLGTEGRVFKSHYSEGGITQWLECWSVTPKVAGSNPVSPEPKWRNWYTR